MASSIGSGSSTAFAAAYKARGTFGARFTNGAGVNCYRRYPLGTAATTWQFSGVFTLPASLPAANMTILGLVNSGGSMRVALSLNSSGQVLVNGAGGSGTATVSTALATGSKYRFTIQCVGGSTTASDVTVKVYSEASGSWTTQVGSTWHSSTYNTGTDNVIGADLGIINSPAASYTVGWDDIRVNDGAGSEIGDIVEQLATPVVTLGAATNPSTVGGSDGSQVVTWAAVPSASSYEAWIAFGASPVQGDFTLVATGVTSPYTFTGLTAGERAYGIKAKA